ncbi:MAG: hypothetical protein FD127_3049 [Acidimicrobiaceae bacterium]|nr:MAG: hypothetical protein FD127_3049 [Acidimicrobiaceae bacterium]
MADDGEEPGAFTRFVDEAGRVRVAEVDDRYPAHLATVPGDRNRPLPAPGGREAR